MYYHLIVQSKCIRKSIRCKLESFLLLTFSGRGFQQNRPFSSLPGQADFIKFSGNSHTTLFARQVLKASNQTGPRWLLLLPFHASTSCWPRCRCLHAHARSLRLEIDVFSGEWSDKVLGIKGSLNVMGPGCTMASLCLLWIGGHGKKSV